MHCALFFSFLVHIILFFIATYGRRPDNSDVAPPEKIAITIVRQGEVEVVEKTEKLVQEELLPSKPSSIDVSKAPKEAGDKVERVVHAKPKPVVASPSKSPSKALDLSIPAAGWEVQREAGGCTSRQEASGIWSCMEDGTTTTQNVSSSAYEGAFATAFKHLNLTDSVKKDLARLERLVEDKQRLDELYNTPGVDRELVVAKRMALTEEMQRLDKKYETVNLLKIITVGETAVKNGVELLKSN